MKALDHVHSITPYVPGKPIEELERELGISGSIKLASNENPLGPSPLAVAALAGTFDLNRYPDGGCFYLRRAVAELLSVGQESLIFGNGSNELLDLVVRTYMNDGDEAVMGSPSFVVYAMAVQSVGGRSVQVPLDSAYAHDLDAMASAVGPKTRIVFVANPNNPTGTINTKKQFDDFMQRIPDDVLVVVDQAYYEYVSASDYADCMNYFRDGRNILILRTFSKIYGLAGLRIGYGLAPKDIISDMNRIRAPFNTGSLSQKAALEALRDKQHLTASVENNEAGKKYLYEGLSSCGLSFVPTEANFVYLPVDDSVSLYEKLLKLGVIVRPMGPRALRITIGLPDENRRLIAALKSVLGLRNEDVARA